MATIVGTVANDNLHGTDENDRIWGLGGSDIMDGAAGNDRLDGGAGNDVLTSSSGYDELDGADGDDRFVLTGTGGAARGGAGVDTLAVDLSSTTASVRFNSLNGHGLIGDPSAAGNHIYFRDVERLELTTGSGNDTVQGDTGDDVISTGDGRDWIGPQYPNALDERSSYGSDTIDAGAAKGGEAVAEEHFATAVLRARLLGLARGWDRGVGLRALLACPAGGATRHRADAFGLALRQHGWRIVFLGADSPRAALAAAGVRLDVHLVVMSSVAQVRVAPFLRGLRLPPGVLRGRRCGVGESRPLRGRPPIRRRLGRCRCRRPGLRNLRAVRRSAVRSASLAAVERAPPRRRSAVAARVARRASGR